MGDSNYQQVLRKYAARVDDYQNIYSIGTLSQCNGTASHKARAYYNWLPSPTLTRENAEELIKQAEPYWLYPKLTRNQVTSLLFDKPHGSFLVRESSSSNCYALSVRLPSDEPPVKHYLIECIPNGYAIQGSGLPFPTIPKLLAYFCFSTSGGMPCFLRPPVLPDAETSTDYAPMSDVSGLEQNNFQGTPVLGWTGPSSTTDSATTVVITDAYHVSLSARKPQAEPLGHSNSVPPQLPPRTDTRSKDGPVRRRTPRSILLQQDSDDRRTYSFAAQPYAIVPIGQRSTELKSKSVADSGLDGLKKKRAPHVYDEIDVAEELKRKEELVPAASVDNANSEETFYAEPNIEYDGDSTTTDEAECVLTPPPLPPRAPSMTPPCSPTPASICSPAPTSDDEYIEPEVIYNINKPNRSHSAPPSSILSVNHPVSPKSPPKSPLKPSKSPPKSPKIAAKEKKPKLHKRGGTLYNILRTFKRKTQSGVTNITRILPEHIPSEEVNLFKNSVSKYNLDLPNDVEEAGSELQRRLSGKNRHGKQGTLTRHRSLSPLDAYVDMHPESRPLSSSDYYEPMQLQVLRQQLLSQSERVYDIPPSSPSPSPPSEEEGMTDRISLRKSKSETSLMVDEPSKAPALSVTVLSHLSQSTDCVLNSEISDNPDVVSPAKSVEQDVIRPAKSVEQVDHEIVSSTKSVEQADSDVTVEVKQPTPPPRLQKPPIGPKPQLKPKPSLPPKPANLITRPAISPRTKYPPHYAVPKLPPKPTASKSDSALHNSVVTKTKPDVRIPEDVGDNDRRVLKPVGKAPPPPPPKSYRSTSFVMVKKPPAAKGPYAVPSTTSNSSNNKGGSSPAKSPTGLPDTAESKRKETVGVVVELKESDDDELEHIEYTVDSGNTTEQSLTTSSEVDGTVSAQESLGKKRNKIKKLKKNWHPFTFLHKKPSEQRIKEFLIQLSLNKNSVFGHSVAQFLSTTRREVPNLSYQQLLSNIRNYIDSSREKLQKEYSKELIEHGMKGCRNFEVLLEKILQDIIVQPLQQVIQFKIEKHFLETGSLQQLQRNITAAKTLVAADLGIRDHLIPPEGSAIDEAQKLFNQMQNAHSAFSKMELLLQAVRITYDNVQDSLNKNKSSRHLGADDFLPLFIWVLIHADFCKAEVEAEYMWGLVHPSLLNGEGGYYLTTLTSAVNVLKETQFSLEDQQEIKDLPGMDDSQAFLCVWIEEIDGCACEPPISKTLPVHVSMTVEQTCTLISNTFKISNPQAYGLYAIASSSETLLEKDQYPQRIKHDLLAKHQSGRFVYKTIQ